MEPAVVSIGPKRQNVVTESSMLLCIILDNINHIGQHCLLFRPSVADTQAAKCYDLSSSISSLVYA